MEYNEKLWDDYTDENLAKQQKELSKFIYYSTLSLGAQKICEAGCNVGNNLLAFPKDFDIVGFDLNEKSLLKAKDKFPHFIFERQHIKKTSFSESYFDLVFTRGVLIHIPKNEIEDVLKELLRISKKWIMNLEYFGTDGQVIKWKRGDNLLWYRNMKKLWSEFNVEILSDVDVPINIDEGKVRMTIVKKL